jgi:hypothetical protein
MKNSRASYSRIAIALVALATVPGATLSLRGQETANAGLGVAADWTHHHVVFSHPGTSEEAVQSGTHDRWLKIAKDPRYTMQQRKRSQAETEFRGTPRLAPADVDSVLDPDMTGEAEPVAGAVTHLTEKDFPGGELPRGLARALVPPRSQQSEFLSKFREAAVSPNATKRMHRMQKDWSETEGNNGTVGLNHFPATFTNSSANCTADMAVYNTGLAGSSSQANLVAYNQLYSGCNPRPSTYWAYDTGGTAVTSVALSLDGTQVAFVQTDNTTTHADLVVLKWAPSNGTLTSPAILTSNSSFPNCTAPCMIMIALHGSPSDTDSSPFIDYESGTAYVGDDTGAVHKFTNIFSAATPAEATNPWPVTVNPSTGAALSSPVYDSISGNIFVGDYLAGSSSPCQPGLFSLEGECGYLYSVSASSGAVARSAQLDYNLGIYDGPIVDSSAGTVYAFIGADNSTHCSSGPCAAVFQFPVGFSAAATGKEATVGAGYEYLMSGSFDNQYFTSGNSPSGHLYVVGGTGPQNNTLYAITINNNGMTTGSAAAGPTVAANYTNGYYAAGLAVTEFCNNGDNNCTASQGTDYLFLGVLGFGSQFATNPCPSQSLSNGCIMGFNVPMMGGTISSSATPNGALQEAGGPSGIVVDNGASGASNIYFSTLLNQICTTSGGSGGCAVSATQKALQ